MKIDKIKIKNAINEGWITKSKHKEYPLFLYNYTMLTQYERVWDDLTLLSRGLILDAEYNIISRPLRKFFNIEEYEEDSLFLKSFITEGYEILDKADGSFGILYEYNGNYAISTRGSFHSPQAEWATKFINKKENIDFIKSLDTDNYTYVFEIIYFDNRIVIEYDFENLIILAKIRKSDGWVTDYNLVRDEFNKSTFGFVNENPEYKNLSFKELKDLNLPNKEGFVLRNKTDKSMVKIKFKDYLELHSIVTELSARHIWAELKRNGDFEIINKNIPDEFFEWVDMWKEKLLNGFSEMESYYFNEYKKIRKDLGVGFTDKEFGLFVKEKYKKTDWGFLFKLLRNQEIDDLIWKRLYPHHEKAFSI